MLLQETPNRSYVFVYHDLVFGQLVKFALSAPRLCPSKGEEELSGLETMLTKLPWRAVCGEFK